jgi:hypothetical protein
MESVTMPSCFAGVLPSSNGAGGLCVPSTSFSICQPHLGAITYLGTLINTTAGASLNKSISAVGQRVDVKNIYVVYGLTDDSVIIPFKRARSSRNDDPTDGELLQDPNGVLWKLVIPYFMDANTNHFY